MSQKNKKRLCYTLACLILLAGIYVTFDKADSMTGHTVVTRKATIQMPSESTAYGVAYIMERTGSVLQEAVGRVMQRNQSLRRELRPLILFFYALCVANFILKCRVIEEILCLREKKYRKAVIKYIHDIDGKKRMACPT